jgi:hypothetical protein
MKLITSLQIDTGTTKRQRYSGRSTPLFLRVTGTPDQMLALLRPMAAIPNDQGFKVGFNAGLHPTGCIIHNKLTTPINAEFSENLDRVINQLETL